MKKAFRVKKNEDFQWILKNGQYFANRQFVVYYIYETGRKQFCFGISVGKKLGHAVLRNRIKRKIRACIRDYQAEIPNNIKMIVMARNGCINLSHEDFEKGFVHLLVHAKIIRRKESEKS